ncbi:MAG TPA: hypothetical protein VGC09_23260 [Rhodopila sp.]
MSVIRLPSKASKGLSFTDPELMLIQSSAEAHGLRMVVRLDHGWDGKNHGEVLAFHLGNSPRCLWSMWCDAGGVFIRPPLGRSRRFGSVAEALEAMTRKQHMVVTDINAPCWPVQGMA